MSRAILKNVGRAGTIVWRRLPQPVRDGPPGQLVGNWIHALSRRFSARSQSESTWFLRNQPLLTTILGLINRSFPSGSRVRICSMACSSGAELYSILWLIRKTRPDLDVVPLGVDVSKSALERAQQGCYLRGDAELRGSLSDEILNDLFERNGQSFRVKDWVGRGTRWTHGDACDPRIQSIFGLQDVVLANNFLIHMQPPRASEALVNVSKLVKPGGILVCRGVDLNVRQKVASRLHLEPLPLRIEAIHNSELELDARHRWPWRYDGLEPLNRNRKDWIQRYAAVFRVPVPTDGSPAETPDQA
jgi:chemotaxis methyl-accepting protein methylase